MQLNDGDRVLWYWATFGPTGGPPTLHLTRTGRNCYRVVSENDEGTDRAAAVRCCTWTAGGFAPARAAPASASTPARCGRRSPAPSARTRSGK